MIKVNKVFFYKVSAGLILSIWFLVSYAAFAAMYNLWWQRERVEYLGKPVHEQRLKVWQYAGLPAELLQSVYAVQQLWSEEVNYTFAGEHNNKSYAEYLLLPRIPAGSDGYYLHTDGTFRPSYSIGASTSALPENQSWGLFGLIGSMLTLTGASLLTRCVFRHLSLSFPECFSIAIFILMILALLSKLAFQTIVPGFVVTVILGCTGPLLYLRSGARSPNFFMGLKRSATGLRSSSTRGIQIWTVLMVILLFLSVCWSFIMAVVVVPDDWDAWAIWGAKAKLLLLGSGPLVDVTKVGHADYPLLWPMLWAYSAWFSGGWEEMWSRGWGAILYALVLWEMVIVIYQSNGKIQYGLFGAALFATMPMTPLVVSWSYAETPFWLFTATGLGCLFRWRETGRLGYAGIGSLLITGAAYTKNEGMLFFCVVMLWLCTACYRNDWRAMIIFALIFLASLAPWLYWIKLYLQLGSHATDGLDFMNLDIARIVDRSNAAIDSIMTMWADVRQWGVSLFLCFFLALTALSGKKRWSDFLIPFLLFTGYLAVIVLHQAEIYWQVGTAWNRLTLQVMPMLILITLSNFNKGGDKA